MKRKSEQAELDRAEWDFLAVPESEMRACVRYELVREIADVESYCLREARSRSRARPFSHEIPYVYADENESIVDDCIRIMYPRFAWHPGDGMPTYLLDLPWQKLPSLVREQVNHFSKQLHSALVPGRMPTPYNNDPDSPWNTSGFGHENIEFSIDWTQPTSQIVGEFADWVNRNRPKEFNKAHSHGRQSIRDDLNSLAALRLRHHFRADAASALTAMVLGKPLYTSAFAWARAADRAVELFQSTFTDVGAPKSAARKANVRGRPRKITFTLFGHDPVAKIGIESE